ncbi:unnamed protein product [Caenorhabditis sp. 36 PRJEB53466]|nr:unnamed protein product [Caenorhabditis sp. 36 PRJEB53466]
MDAATFIVVAFLLAVVLLGFVFGLVICEEYGQCIQRFPHIFETGWPARPQEPGARCACANIPIEMLSFLNNPAVQFLIVVFLVCAIAIGSCCLIERMVGVLFPVTDQDFGRVMYVPHDPVNTNPTVTIRIESPTVDVDEPAPIADAEEDFRLFIE